MSIKQSLQSFFDKHRRVLVGKDPDALIGKDPDALLGKSHRSDQPQDERHPHGGSEDHERPVDSPER